MKTTLKILVAIVILAVFGVVAVSLATPWMDRWGAMDAEINATLPGDELLASPASVVNHAVTINAAPELIYPWIIQMGAGKGGLYSYTWLETNLIRCPLVNADRIHPEWQYLAVGDEVKMCPNQPAPPPYIVARLDLNRAVVLGHQENGQWNDLWQFVIIPQADGSSHLVLRTRTMMNGGFWSIIHPGVFIMERQMLIGIKERAEALALREAFLPTLNSQK